MLDIENIKKTFHAGTPNEVRALQGVDLRIEKGSFVIVIGTNGSGKSTLLNAVAGSFFVDTGKLRLKGQDITRWPEHRRAKYIGRVFQNPFTGTAPSLTIAENLALAAKRGRMRGLGWALSAARRDEMYERVRAMGLGLENRLGNAIGSLSGGQRQSLTLLMAGLIKPDLLLLDEPTAGLDPQGRDAMLRLLHAIASRHGKSLILSTHLLGDIDRVCKQVIIMDRGTVLGCGRIGDLRQHWQGRYRIRWREPELRADNPDDGQSFLAILRRACPVVTANQRDSEALIEVPEGWNNQRLFEMAIQSGVVLSDIVPEDENLPRLYHRLIGTGEVN